MQAIVLILLFVAGYLLLSRIDGRASKAERIGFAFPVGLALATFLMFVSDAVCLPLTRQLVIVIAVVLFVVTLVLYLPKAHKPAMSFDLSWFNVLWFAGFLLVVYIAYANLVKTLYFPVYDRDSLAGFDTLGFLAAREHTFHSLFIFDADYNPSIHGPGSYISYMPMLQLSYALVYLFGAETSKIIPALLWPSFLVGLYGLARRFFRTSLRLSRGGDTAAILVLVGMSFAIEMFAFSSLSGTNVPQAIVASAGMLYVLMWYRNRALTAPLVVGSVLLAISCFIRLEGFIFSFIAFCVVLVGVIKDRRSNTRRAWLRPLLPLLSVFPIVLFQIYTKVYALTAESTIIAHFYWDGAKVGVIAHYAWGLLASIYYGFTFYTLLIAVIVSLPLLIRGRGVMTYLAFIAAMVMYYVVLYQIDYKWDTIENVLNFSAKRFLFCFVPIAWVAALCQGNLARLLDWVERKCGLQARGA